MTSTRFIILLIFAVNICFSPAILSKSFLDETQRPSPLKKSKKNSAIHKLQNTFHKIYNQYKNSVVFISTQKTIKERYRNPFSGDPFFQEFFGRKNRRPRRRKKETVKASVPVL